MSRTWMYWHCGYIFQKHGILQFYTTCIWYTGLISTYIIQMVAFIPTILTGKFALFQLCMWICKMLAGSWREDSSSCKAWKWRYSASNSSYEEVSWGRFLISLSFRVALSAKIAISPLSWTSVVVIIGAGFFIRVNVFVELLVAGLVINCTVFFPRTWVLVGTTLGVTTDFIVIGSRTLFALAVSFVHFSSVDN